MQRLTAAVVALAFGWGAWGQDKKDSGGDKIGKDKAPAVARKAIAEVQKRKGAAISFTGEMSGGSPQAPKVTGTFEGVMRKETAGVKGTLEIYARAGAYLVNTGARFDSPDDVEPQMQNQAHTFKNPSLLIAEVSKLVNAAAFGVEESVDGKDCRELTFVADDATVKQCLKEIGERLNKQFKAFAGGFGGGALNFANAMDEKNTTATYQVYVGKDDLLVYRILFVIKPQLKPNALPPQVPKISLEQRYDVRFSKWDEDLPLDLPGPVKAKWGVK